MFNGSPIKSKDNARLKFARRVRDGKELGHIFIEGSRLCNEALGSNLAIVSCFVSEGLLGSRPANVLKSKLISGEMESFVVSDKLLNSISDTKTPQGIILIAKRPKAAGLAEVLSVGNVPNVSILLYRVNNPSNLGALIRTAEAAGARSVIISDNSADPFSPRSLRASMGSAFRLPIVDDLATEETLKRARAKGIKITAVHAAGKRSYADVDWKMPRLLVFGSEAEGLPDRVILRVDDTVRIPMHGNVESLNLAVSAGIVLFEAKRQIEAME